MRSLIAHKRLNLKRRVIAFADRGLVALLEGRRSPGTWRRGERMRSLAVGPRSPSRKR